jgi:hypothetical protein
MSLKPGDSYTGLFCTSRGDTGAASNADSLPTATMTRNGTDDGTVTLTVANLDTGRYKVTGTVPSGYASGDAVQVWISATVNSVAAKAVIDSFVLDTKRLSDLIDSNSNVKSVVYDYLTGKDPATLVLDVAASAHSISNSIGGFINQVGSIADPLSSAVPGSYASDTAGWVLGHIALSSVTFSSPALLQGTTLTFVRGDDYYAADGRSFDMTDSGWPDLTSCVSITFHLWPKGSRTAAILTVTMSTVTTGGTPQTVRLEMSRTNTGTTVTDPGHYDWDAVAILANGHTVTLRAGAAIALGL